MTDQHRTQLSFVAGLLAALVLAPVLALARSRQNRPDMTHDTPQPREAPQ